MPRITLKVCALLLLLPLASCTKKTAPKVDPDRESFYEFRAKAVAEIRQIEGVRAFALLHEKDQTSPLAIGEFRRIKTSRLNAEGFDELFPFYVTFDRSGSLTGFGRLKMLRCPIPLPKPWGSFNIKTNDPGPWVSTTISEPLPDAFQSPRFTAIFPTSQIDYHTKEWGVSKDQKAFAFHEIPSAWSPGAIAILSGKESSDEPIEQASPLGTVFCFLHALRAAEADHSLAEVPRRQLTDLITRKADPQLIETLFYLAIHPETNNPYAEDYWRMFMAAFKNGSIAPSSAARLGRVFCIFSGLPRDKTEELYNLLWKSPLKSIGFKFWDRLSDEDRRFLTAQYGLRHMILPGLPARYPWPKPPPAQ